MTTRPTTDNIPDESGQIATQQLATEQEQPKGEWYIVHCYSGQEDQVKKRLEQRIGTMDVGDRVLEVIVPKEDVVEFREGKRTTRRERLFPGYLMVRMVVDDQTWSVVRNTPGVTGFVSADDEHGGQRARPLPLSEQEVASIMQRVAASQPRAKVGYTKGQSVKIVDGPFKEFIGVVDEVQQDRGKIKVLVSFFGRETPVELDFLQVERVV
ncbi:MAG: transcription termination/antitermination factor NusG [Dehalococcoidia bacterium]|nr:transcription termination/antitermination factor NusG [Dehalococcoidia bacterium]